MRSTTTTERRQTAAEWLRLQAAARHARIAYPGPVGDLLARELVSYAELGWLVPDGVIETLVRELEAHASAEPGRRVSANDYEYELLSSTR